MKKLFMLFTITITSFILTGCGISETEYEEVVSQKTAAIAEVDKLKSDYNKLKSDYDILLKENEDYKLIIEPYKKLSESEILAKTTEATLKAEKDRKELEELQKKEAEEKAAAEQAEKEAKEKEERQGYETGITFNQLARTPDDYIGKKVKFTGEVIQVIEGVGIVQLRIAVNSDYDKVVFVEYSSSIVKSRILDDDIITIYGMSLGLYTYKSSLGSSITVPAISVDKIDQW